MSAVRQELDRYEARRRVAAAREALRRSKAGEPAFDKWPELKSPHCHLGALQAHVDLLATALEALLPANSA